MRPKTGQSLSTHNTSGSVMKIRIVFGSKYARIGVRKRDEESFTITVSIVNEQLDCGVDCE